ncbi:uncharacterized protein FMAN_04373 [Fusarium mangiferae]|uniref:Uncharacterized protein n=1 Tax=Fusarium mangiferae TaxID=192010 RepID=A0A1L7T1Z9_FUSMA|nr:uncharacterized protein FMAN_04373 [Fusarium mangiferae]CVK89341.1 uncharacterized protein FMAN_04373 [Fusarium mangiferae]
MPKRSLDAANMGSPIKPALTRKTERSHEENQERAYIAASRRADRSLEARVQSAKMASEIHKKRTGKAFRITEQIVMKEEMYEEEDDEFPRSYRILNQNLQTDNPAFNARVDAYLINRVALSQMMSATESDWRNNEINMEFAKMFPQAKEQAQSLSHRYSTPGYSALHAQNNTISSPMEQHFEPNFQPINYGQPCNNGHGGRSLSMSGPISEPRNDTAMSPSALTPGLGSHPETPQPHCTASFANVQPPHMMEYNADSSAFTSELPTEARLLMGGGMNETFSSALYPEPHNWVGSQSYPYSGDSKYVKEEDAGLGIAGESYPEISDTVPWDRFEAGTPTKTFGDQEPAWDYFLNENWGNDQQQQ